jgi:hypothetical protein
MVAFAVHGRWHSQRDHPHTAQEVAKVAFARSGTSASLG